MAVSKDYYKDLSCEELVQDEYFILSTQQPSRDSEQFWNEFLLAYPQKAEEWEAARQMIRSLTFQSESASEGTKERIWASIVAKEKAPVVKMMHRRGWMGVAAAIAGLLIMATFFFLQGDNAKTSISSSYAEIKKVVLPDQSVVTLNANSSLEYKKEWKQGQPREVWINGEGFFEVSHLHKAGRPVQESERFIVHAGDLHIEVLGTSFNVSDRNSMTSVVLQKGKVRLDFTNHQRESVIMEPGDLVKYDGRAHLLVKEKTNLDKAVSWTKKEIILNNTSVRELASIIENYYGYAVQVDDKEILDRQLSGTGIISLDDEQTLWKAIELILGVAIKKENKTLRIMSR